MALCRVFVILLLGGVAFLATNMILLWNQNLTQQCPTCDCGDGGGYSLHVKRVVELPTSQSSQGSVVSDSVPEVVKNVQNINKPDSLLRLLNKTRHQQMQETSGHQLAVIVPFRNRYEEMMEFVPHIHTFLERQNVKHKIWIVNQDDTHRCVHMLCTVCLNSRSL